MSGYPRKVGKLSWDHSSRYLVTGGRRNPCLSDCSGRGPAGTTPLQLDFHERPLSAVAFQRAGAGLASGALDGSIALWGPDRPAPLGTFGFRDEIVAITWLAGDSGFVAGGLSGQVAFLPIDASARVD